MTPEAALAAALQPALRGSVRRPLGVAVSGGGDSLALLYLAAEWGAANGVPIHAATVDHGLRPEAAAEAAGVARHCAGLGISHQILHWTGWDGQGNVQDQARQARRHLLTNWAQAEGLEVVLLGHTADDQAETVLMRLARGSGVDGLAGMGAHDPSGLFIRPLLPVRRAALRDWLRTRGLTWIEDPSNDDPRYDRVKARQMLGLLSPLGLTVDRLTETAGHMQRAQITLREAARHLARSDVRAEAGDLILSRRILLGEDDAPRRVLSAAVQWIGDAPYRPRHAALMAAADACLAGEARTLGGVMFLPGKGGARLMREPASSTEVLPCHDGPMLWDGRWKITAIEAPSQSVQIAALGEAGLAQCPLWRETGLPRTTLLASPGIWHGDRLISAPLAGFGNGWVATLTPSFESFLLSH